MKALFGRRAKRYRCADLFTAIFAEIDGVFLRKEEDVAQLRHATGEPRHIGCKWVSIWKRGTLTFPGREIFGQSIA